MKVLTKEWIKDFELGDLMRIVNSESVKKFPLVFLNGGNEDVGKDLNLFKTNLELTDKENEMGFILVSNWFDFLPQSQLSTKEENDPQTASNEAYFFSQYINTLRVISELPQDIFKGVKDKRLLVFGYANEEVKTAIKNYVGNKYEIACQKWEKSNYFSEIAGKSLTANKQFKKRFLCSKKISHLLQETRILNFSNKYGEIRIMNDNEETAILKDAKTITEEINPKHTYIRVYELYKNENGYEIHFLLERCDENLINKFYYATYSFKDMEYELPL